MEGKASAVCNLNISLASERRSKPNKQTKSILDEGGVFSVIHYNERSENFKDALISARLISTNHKNTMSQNKKSIFKHIYPSGFVQWDETLNMAASQAALAVLRLRYLSKYVQIEFIMYC